MAKDVSQHPEDFPSNVDRRRGLFSGVLDAAMRVITSWPFFVLYLVLASGWLLVGVLYGFGSGWIDTVVVVSAFLAITLMVILENTSRHSHLAVQMKLNALALALLTLMREADQREAREELQRAIGLERHVHPEGMRE